MFCRCECGFSCSRFCWTLQSYKSKFYWHFLYDAIIYIGFDWRLVILILGVLAVPSSISVHFLWYYFSNRRLEDMTGWEWIRRSNTPLHKLHRRQAHRQNTVNKCTWSISARKYYWDLWGNILFKRCDYTRNILSAYAQIHVDFISQMPFMRVIRSWNCKNCNWDFLHKIDWNWRQEL